MKLTRILSCATALLVLVSPAAFAAKGAGKGDPAKKAARQAARAMARFDTNNDGVISGDETAALREAFKTDPLRAADRNADGTLDDSEIAALKIEKHAGKGGKKKKNAV
jgi:EF hand